MTKYQQISITLPENLANGIRIKAKSNAQSFSGIVKICLEKYLERGDFG